MRPGRYEQIHLIELESIELLRRQLSGLCSRRCRRSSRNLLLNNIPTGGRAGLVESRCRLLNERQHDSGGGGAAGVESVLRVSKDQVGRDVLDN